eukprot:g2883.t1
MGRRDRADSEGCISHHCRRGLRSRSMKFKYKKQNAKRKLLKKAKRNLCEWHKSGKNGKFSVKREMQGTARRGKGSKTWGCVDDFSFSEENRCDHVAKELKKSTTTKTRKKDLINDVVVAFENLQCKSIPSFKNSNSNANSNLNLTTEDWPELHPEEERDDKEGEEISNGAPRDEHNFRLYAASAVFRTLFPNYQADEYEEIDIDCFGNGFYNDENNKNGDEKIDEDEIDELDRISIERLLAAVMFRTKWAARYDSKGPSHSKHTAIREGDPEAQFATRFWFVPPHAMADCFITPRAVERLFAGMLYDEEYCGETSLRLLVLYGIYRHLPPMRLQLFKSLRNFTFMYIERSTERRVDRENGFTFGRGRQATLSSEDKTIEKESQSEEKRRQRRKRERSPSPVRRNVNEQDNEERQDDQRMVRLVLLLSFIVKEELRRKTEDQENVTNVDFANPLYLALRVLVGMAKSNQLFASHFDKIVDISVQLVCNKHPWRDKFAVDFLIEILRMWRKHRLEAQREVLFIRWVGKLLLHFPNQIINEMVKKKEDITIEIEEKKISFEKKIEIKHPEFQLQKIYENLISRLAKGIASPHACTSSEAIRTLNNMFILQNFIIPTPRASIQVKKALSETSTNHWNQTIRKMSDELFDLLLDLC